MSIQTPQELDARTAAPDVAPDLVSRYIANYDLSEPVKLEQILQHWNLERQLRRELLSAPATDRWRIFDEGYTRLYRELWWLNQCSVDPPDESFLEWLDLAGSTSNKVYEIGSGKGHLMRMLARAGLTCTATEITRERGKKWVTTPGIEWKTTDGVHLDQFEHPNTYDLVVSNQVVEHIHPDDVADHLRSVAVILKPGGRYLMATPHCYFGPADVSRVFRSGECLGLHLKEYTYRELIAAAKRAGFKKISASLRFPGILRRRSRWFRSRASRLYLAYLQIVERVLEPLPQQIRRLLVPLLRVALFRANIFLVLEKPTAP